MKVDFLADFNELLGFILDFNIFFSRREKLILSYGSPLGGKFYE